MDIVSKSGTAAELITAASQAANAMPDDPFFSLKLAEAHLRALTSGKGNPSIHAVAAQKAARKLHANDTVGLLVSRAAEKWAGFYLLLFLNCCFTSGLFPKMELNDTCCIIN